MLLMPARCHIGAVPYERVGTVPFGGDVIGSGPKAIGGTRFALVGGRGARDCQGSTWSLGPSETGSARVAEVVATVLLLGWLGVRLNGEIESSRFRHAILFEQKTPVLALIWFLAPAIGSYFV